MFEEDIIVEICKELEAEEKDPFKKYCNYSMIKHNMMQHNKGWWKNNEL